MKLSSSDVDVYLGDSIMNNVYAIEHKKKLAKRGLIKCDRCPWHRKENESRKPRRSWKARTKRKRQHK
jgi:hypothetical protein